MSAIAIIPARGGSQRIPGKNKRIFFGKPIVAYSIECAMESRLFSEIIVSTDDPEIMQIARDYGATPVVRLTLADAKTGTQEVMGHVLRTHSHPIERQACCIYATCPMMTPGDLIRGWTRLNVPRTVYAMSVGTDPLADAGMFYWGWTNAFVENVPLISINTGIVPIPGERVCDINTPEDWARAEQMYQRWKEQLCPEVISQE